MKSLILISILILSNLFLVSYIAYHLNPESFVAFLNVGQGSSILIFNNKLKMMYDVGPYGLRTLNELNKLIKAYDKKIDIVFISHPDKDHYGGIFDLIERYQIRLIIISPLYSIESGYLKFLNLAQKRKIPLLALSAGDRLETPFEKLFIIHPDRYYSNDNQNSLVIKLIKNKKTYLLTGDIDQKIEKHLLNKYDQNFLRADYLLIPHHGSRYSSLENFLVNFRWAIIQVGENKYGHPHQEVIEKLKKLNLPYWRTDLNGTFVVK
jgi:competence protein ComEC